MILVYLDQGAFKMKLYQIPSAFICNLPKQPDQYGAGLTYVTYNVISKT